MENSTRKRSWSQDFQVLNKKTRLQTGEAVYGGRGKIEEPRESSGAIQVNSNGNVFTGGSNEAEFEEGIQMGGTYLYRETIQTRSDSEDKTEVPNLDGFRKINLEEEYSDFEELDIGIDELNRGVDFSQIATTFRYVVLDEEDEEKLGFLAYIGALNYQKKLRQDAKMKQEAKEHVLNSSKI